MANAKSPKPVDCTFRPPWEQTREKEVPELDCSLELTEAQAAILEGPAAPATTSVDAGTGELLEDAGPGAVVVKR